MPDMQLGGIASASAPAWLSNLLMPSGALAETFPRIHAQSTLVTTSGGTVIGAIPLAAGTKVSNISVITSGTAEAGGTHGFVALTDATGKVLGVSADQVSATWLSPAATEITTALTSPVVIPAAGTYYVVLGVTAVTPPSVMALASGGVINAMLQTPILGGNAGAVGTPPAVGSTLTLSATANSLYAYVS